MTLLGNITLQKTAQKTRTFLTLKYEHKELSRKNKDCKKSLITFPSTFFTISSNDLCSLINFIAVTGPTPAARKKVMFERVTGSVTVEKMNQTNEKLDENIHT